VCKTKNIFLIEQQINVYALPKKNYTKSESLKVGKILGVWFRVRK